MVHSRRTRRGLTLVEMLVAMAITLAMIYGMVLAFGQVGKEASDGRAKIEMANQMRNVMRRLETDLNGLTVPVRNWNPSGAAAGQLEGVGAELASLVVSSTRSWEDSGLAVGGSAGEVEVAASVLTVAVGLLERTRRWRGDGFSRNFKRSPSGWWTMLAGSGSVESPKTSSRRRDRSMAEIESPPRSRKERSRSI